MELMSFGDGHPMLQRLAGSPGFRKSYSDYGFGALRDPNCLKCLHGACSSHAMELGNGLLVVHSPDGAQMHFGYAAQCSECSTATLASGGKPLRWLPRSAQDESRCVTYGFAGTGDWADPECEQCMFGCCSGHAVKVEEETPAESLSDTIGKEGIPVKEPSGTTADWHIGRWSDGHQLEDACPCPKAPCGLVIRQQAICEEHALTAGKAMRQGHPATHCPGIPVKEDGYDAVEPPHYRRGPEIELGNCDTYGQWRERKRYTVERNGKLHIVVTCIEVMRHIKDPRLATALRYMWRVAFGGKRDPKEILEQRDKDVEDIRKAIWYLQDWIDNPVP